MLTQCDHNQNSASAATHKSRKSKRWRTVCEQQTAEASHSLCGNDEQNSAVMVNEDLLVGTASHIDNSIMGDMPSNTISRRTRRMLRQCDRTENCAPTKVFFTSDESHQVISRKSKRWKAASQQPATEALDTFSGNHEQNVAAPINENLLVGTASHIDYSITEGTFYRESIFTFTWSGIISKNKASFDNKMEYVLIRDMQSYESEYKIKVRISRVWRAKKFNTDKDDGLQCVLVDEQGDAIHAIVTESDYPMVRKKLEQGKVYHINKFFTRKSHENYKILDHESQAYFNGKTVFEPVEECFPLIPEHRFYLVEFDQLRERMNDMTIRCPWLFKIDCTCASNYTHR